MILSDKLISVSFHTFSMLCMMRHLILLHYLWQRVDSSLIINIIVLNYIIFIHKFETASFLIMYLVSHNPLFKSIVN